MNSINIAGMNAVIEAIKDVYSAVCGTMPGVIAVLVVSLLFCFMGFRLARVVSAVGGAVVGGGLCAFVASSYLPESIASIGTVAAGVIGALLVAYLFYHISYAVVFVICAAAGAALGSVPAMAVGSDSVVFYVILAACALLFGIAGVMFYKPVMIILTGLCGIFAVPQMLTLAGIETTMVIKLLAGIALSVIGMAIQFLTTRGRTKPGFGKKKSKDQAEDVPEGEAAAEDVGDETRPIKTSDIAYEDIDETPEPPRMVADDLNDAMRRKGFMRFLMAIAPVLMLAAAAAVIVFRSAHIEVVVILAFLCYASRRYKLLSVTFLAMFAYTLYSCFPALSAQNMPEFVLTAISCLMFLILTQTMLRMDRKAHPKKRVRRVPVEQTAAADQLEETRPLYADEVADAIPTPQDDGEGTELMEEESDTKTFSTEIPEDFRRTQEEIFGSADSLEDDMAAEPDEAVDSQPTTVIDSIADEVDEALGDTRKL